LETQTNHGRKIIHLDMPDLTLQCDLLADVFDNYYQDPRFLQFVDYYDLALPLAKLIEDGAIAVEPEPTGLMMIQEAYNVLLGMFEVDDRVPKWNAVSDVLEAAGQPLEVEVV